MFIWCYNFINVDIVSVYLVLQHNQCWHHQCLFDDATSLLLTLTVFIWWYFHLYLFDVTTSSVLTLSVFIWCYSIISIDIVSVYLMLQHHRCRHCQCLFDVTTSSVLTLSVFLFDVTTSSVLPLSVFINVSVYLMLQLHQCLFDVATLSVLTLSVFIWCYNIISDDIVSVYLMLKLDILNVIWWYNFISVYLMLQHHQCWHCQCLFDVTTSSVLTLSVFIWCYNIISVDIVNVYLMLQHHQCRHCQC